MLPEAAAPTPAVIAAHLRQPQHLWLSQQPLQPAADALLTASYLLMN